MKIDFRELGADSYRGYRAARLIEAGADSCIVVFGSQGGGIALPWVNSAGKRYLVGDVEIMEEHSAAMMLRCYVKEGSSGFPMGLQDLGEERERIFMRFGLLPGLRTRICLDFELLDNHTIFTNRTPGTLKLVVHGQRTCFDEVERFELGIEETFHDVTVRLSDFYLTDEFPGEFPVPGKKLADEFGQWKEKEWPGKVHSLEELKDAFRKNEGEAEYPFSHWNQFGGDSTRKLKEGNGFFSTCKTEDGRWHLADPLGYDYFSLGPCLTLPGDFGRIDHFKELCDWLPEEEAYQECFRKGSRRRTAYMPEEDFEMISFAAVNLKRVYGDNWQEKWEEVSHHILMSNGINSQGNFPGLSVNNGKTKIPYVRELPGFPTTGTLIFRDFPDVLSPEYEENAEKYAAALSQWKDDKWLIGYFLRNEPEFNFVEDLSVAEEVLHNPADTWCRRGLVTYLTDKYITVEAMNGVWGSSFTEFAELMKPVSGCCKVYPGSTDDIRDYSVYLIREYIRVPAGACRRVDANHLNLGLRWSKANNENMMAGWEYFDVFSINCYDFDPTKDMDFVKNAGVDLPIMLGEFHCGALDRGLTATGLKGVTDQRQRGVMWRYFVEKAASHPYGAGAHWFQYNDQFCLGRFDGENYQIGMVDVCMQPYPELMEAVRETSGVLYQVKNGEMEAFDQRPEAIPMIGY